jgi:heme/copper-type cytochrome/quinol oxidase subunit 1
MVELTQNVNWMAVIVGALLAFFAGWAWYSPKLFGKRWAQGLAIDLAGAPPVAAMMLQGLGLFLLS